MNYADELQLKHENKMRESINGMSETEAMRNAMDASKTIIKMCEELKNAVGSHPHAYAWLNGFIETISAYNDTCNLGFSDEIDRIKIEEIKLHRGVGDTIQRKISLQSIIRDVTPIFDSSLKRFRKAAFNEE